MNSFERFRNRLGGLPVDRAPNFDILMARAARHIRQPLAHFYLDYRVLVQANLAALEDFRLDLVQAISDPYREAADLGLAVQFPDDSLPFNRQPLLLEPEDLSGLRLIQPEAGRRMNDRLEALAQFRRQVGGQVPVMGWVEGGLAELADLRGVGQLLLDLYERPEWVTEALEFCTAQVLAFARAQVSAGADIIGLGDAIASQISPKMYRQFALPAEQRIFAEIKSLGATARLHICGNTSRIVADMAASGADLIDLDWMVDLGEAAAKTAGQAALCGNFDPVGVMLQGSPQTVRQAVLKCLAQGGGRNFSAAGCEIPEGTPLENLLAQHAALCEG